MLAHVHGTLGPLSPSLLRARHCNLQSIWIRCSCRQVASHRAHQQFLQVRCRYHRRRAAPQGAVPKLVRAGRARVPGLAGRRDPAPPSRPLRRLLRLEHAGNEVRVWACFSVYSSSSFRRYARAHTKLFLFSRVCVHASGEGERIQSLIHTHE